MEPLAHLRADMNRRPNILWYCTDQQRYDTIAALGNEFVTTPAMDSLVERGVAFASAYCQSPICTPSRASFLTGMYPSAVGANKNGVEFFPQNYPLITKTLADLGWECGLVGKLHLATATGGVEPRIDDGYSYIRYSHAPRDDWRRGHDYVEWLQTRGVDLESMLADPANVPAEYHQTTWCSDMAIEFIERP
ncbi:MAG: sulfatase-like hydrolase/transferase, partial [Chloroflexi bacterium]|nr:sulfatase-like hydrolase/transferase [Chloroflexota bacterium]